MELNFNTTLVTENITLRTLLERYLNIIESYLTLFERSKSNVFSDWNCK